LYRRCEKDPLPSGTLIPPVNSPESQNLPDKDLTTVPPRDDGIGKIISQVGMVLEQLNDEKRIAAILENIVNLTSDIQVLVAKLSNDLDIEKLMNELNPVLANLRQVSEKLKEPEGSVMSFLSSEGALYGNLVETLEGASGTMQELEGTIGDIHTQTPQLSALFGRLLTTVKSVNQLLESLKNNPLLKGGVPQQKETKAGGSGNRDMEF